jgi:replicative DNA helicase
MIDELINKTAPYAPSKANSANNANSANGVQNPNDSAEAWSPPATLHSIELPEFPCDVFPSWLEAQIEAVAEATQTPRDLASMLGLSVGGAASAKVAEVEVWPGWEEPLNVYTVVALRSGSRKTTVYKRMFTPLEEYETLIVEETRVELAEQRTRYQIHEEKLKKARTKASRTDGDDCDALTAEALQAAADLEAIKVPAAPRLLVDDASPERLTTILADQGGRITLASPEGGVFDMMAGRYSQGIPNLDVYLKAHAGDTIRVDRVGRPADHVPKPALTMGLAVQPEVLQGLASKPGFRGRGLLARNLYSMPQDMLGRRIARPEPVPGDVEKTYKAKITQLLTLSPNLPDDEREPHILRFGPEAQDEMKRLLEWIEPKLAEGAEFGDMTDWAGKLAGAVARLSGILHMLEHAGEKEPWSHEVTADTFRRAELLGRYLIPHAKYALALMGSDPVVEDAKCILRWIERKAVEQFTKREAFEGTKGRFGKVGKLEPGLGLLVSHGYIRESEAQADRRGPGRKPSPTYEVNPLWLRDESKTERHSQYSHYSQNGNGDGSQREPDASEGLDAEEEEFVI